MGAICTTSGSPALMLGLCQGRLFMILESSHSETQLWGLVVFTRQLSTAQGLG